MQSKPYSIALPRQVTKMSTPLFQLPLILLPCFSLLLLYLHASIITWLYVGRGSCPDFDLPSPKRGCHGKHGGEKSNQQ
jgi:hypothetical protein